MKEASIIGVDCVLAGGPNVSDDWRKPGCLVRARYCRKKVDAMSMTACLRTVSDATIDEMLRRPDRVMEVLGLGEDLEAMLPMMFGRKSSPPRLRLRWGDEDDDVADDTPREGEGEQLDLEKSWHGLHYLLADDAWGGREPWCYLVQGGVEVGEDLGYGQPRVLRAAQVRDFANALGSLTEQALRQRFNPAAMARENIYPQIWNEEPPAESWDWLRTYFRELKLFVAAAAGRHLGLIVYLI
jgi:hypothetical protein